MTGWQEAGMTKPGWLIQDHLPYQMDRTPLHLENFATPSLDLCSVPVSLLIKTSASTERYRWALRHESPSSQGAWLCDVGPPSSSWPAPKNKPLSFTSAPASQVLAFIAAGSRTCFQLQFHTARGSPLSADLVHEPSVCDLCFFS